MIRLERLAHPIGILCLVRRSGQWRQSCYSMPLVPMGLLGGTGKESGFAWLNIALTPCRIEVGDAFHATKSSILWAIC